MILNGRSASYTQPRVTSPYSRSIKKFTATCMVNFEPRIIAYELLPNVVDEEIKAHPFSEKINQRRSSPEDAKKKLLQEGARKLLQADGRAAVSTRPSRSAAA